MCIGFMDKREAVNSEQLTAKKDKNEIGRTQSMGAAYLLLAMKKPARELLTVHY